MRTIICGLCALIISAFACCSIAQTADLIPGGTPVLVPKSVVPVFNWTGCYVGAAGGGGLSSDSFTSSSGLGAVAGGQAGCNLQLSQIVIGIEGEGFWSNLAGKYDASPAFATNNLFNTYGPASAVSTITNNRWDADVAARIGVALDRALIFGKVGAAFGHFDMQSTYSNITS